MQKPKCITPKYEVTTYLGGNITTKTMTREELMAINPKSVDHFMSFAFGIWGYRTVDGKWVENKIRWPGFGETCIKIVMAVQFSLEYLTTSDVAEMTGIPGLRNGNNLSARWLAIRRAHKETFDEPHFFLSRRTGGHSIAWNPKYSWMWIERIKSNKLESA